VGNRHLRGENQRAALIAVIADFQEVTPLAALQLSHRKVVEYEDIDAGELQQDAADAAVHMGHRKFSKQLRCSFMQNGETVAAGFVRQGTGGQGFAGAVGPMNRTF
jgi:hypothetical protein